MLTRYGKFLRRYLAGPGDEPLDSTDWKFVMIFTVLILLMLLVIGSCTAGVIA